MVPDQGKNDGSSNQPTDEAHQPDQGPPDEKDGEDGEDSKPKDGISTRMSGQYGQKRPQKTHLFLFWPFRFERVLFFEIVFCYALFSPLLRRGSSRMSL